MNADLDRVFNTYTLGAVIEACIERVDQRLTAGTLPAREELALTATRRSLALAYQSVQKRGVDESRGRVEAQAL